MNIDFLNACKLIKINKMNSKKLRNVQKNKFIYATSINLALAHILLLKG